LKYLKTNQILVCSLFFIVSALMLTVIQPPIGWSVLAWVCYVPFILACRAEVKLRYLLGFSYLVGACYWLGNIYWMGLVTVSGWIVFCLYTGLLWPLLVLCIRFCRTKKFPLIIAVPVLIVGAEHLQGLFLGGFYWRYLAHSQFENISLIQIADIFGAAGLSFLIAMVNAVAAELIIARRANNIFKTANFVKVGLVCVLVAVVFVYGRWRVEQTEEFVTAGPLVSAAQSNVPQSVKESFQAGEKILSDLLELSTKAAEAGADLIVWPETMVTATLDTRVLGLLDESHTFRVYEKTLRDHSRQSDAYLLVGGYGGRPEVQSDYTIKLVERYNSAFLYSPDVNQSVIQYNKIHLVPFGEVVPFRKSVPWLHKLLMWFTPYDYDYSLDAGDEYTVFEMDDKQNRKYRFGVLICYEDAIPAISRRFAAGKAGKKAVDWLVNISNDGWFVRFRDGKVCPSTELAQHTVCCVFRAVENRVAVLRSVNTGVSCLVDTAGRIKNGFFAGTLPKKAIDRQGIAGWFVDRVPIDKRVTFFGICGNWLDIICATGFVVCIITAIAGPKSTERKKKYEKESD